MQCADCNSRLGTEIERDAARFLSSNEWEMTVGPPGVNGIRMDVFLDDTGPVLNFRNHRATNRWGLVRYLLGRSSRPDILECTIKRPHPDALRMAILAWSFCEWSNYSGYAYTATAGANFVRHAILDGSIPIPESAVIFFGQELVPPLREPEPMLVVRAETGVSSLRDVDEFLGLGVGWGGQLVAILPAASDTEGAVYARLLELQAEQRSVRYIQIKPIMAQLGVDRLSKVMVVTDDSGDWEMRVTDGIEEDDREAWLTDSFPRRLDPNAGPRRRYPDGVVRHFYMVEDTSDPSTQHVPPRPPRGQRKGLSEKRRELGLLAIQAAPEDVWHIATHLWIINGKPTTYAVFCGSDVAWPGVAQRNPR